MGDRHTEREAERQIERGRETNRERERDIQKGRVKNRERERGGRQTYIQRERQRDK